MVMAEPKRGENHECWVLETNGMSHQVTPCLFPEDDGWLTWAQMCVAGYVESVPRTFWGRSDIVSAWCNEDGGIMEMDYNNAAPQWFTGIHLKGRVLVYVRT